MKIFKKVILIITALALFSTNVLFAEEWYETYENAKKAIDKQRWEQALNLLNSALGVKSKTKDKRENLRTSFYQLLSLESRIIAWETWQQPRWI